ncbi:MAG: N-acetylmuramoyl-L-alanine amidase [Sphingobacteriales bacterium]|nr:N-acetylmuramoyl-L-alanine amidase [Sphingobacteriales bacterium]OJW35518.1 MAG: N-acetylmuramoyl-L-alanine amidase [Sphingobacteriales bacterium 46-32]
MRTIEFIIIHCTATPVTVTLESMKAYWKNVLGWKNPGYHYLILPSGEIQTVTSEQNIANGVAGHNRYSIHLAYVGGIDEKGKALDNRTDAQKQAMYAKLLELAGRYPDATIRGHRDFSPDTNHNGVIEPFEWIKGCPAFDVTTWLENYDPISKAA